MGERREAGRGDWEGDMAKGTQTVTLVAFALVVVLCAVVIGLELL
jgi:hypothetical protein